MASHLDTLEFQFARLKRMVEARESGLPATLVIVAKGAEAASPESVQIAIERSLRRYGLSEPAEAKEAGCAITVCLLPWLTERSLSADTSQMADDIAHRFTGDYA